MSKIEFPFHKGDIVECTECHQFMGMPAGTHREVLDCFASVRQSDGEITFQLQLFHIEAKPRTRSLLRVDSGDGIFSASDFRLVRRQGNSA